jgi:glutamine synthetase
VEAAGLDAIAAEVRSLTSEFAEAIGALEEANSYPDGVEGLELAIYARDHQITAQERVRELGDRLEQVVADDLWPLPKYSEILFVR